MPREGPPAGSGGCWGVTARPRRRTRARGEALGRRERDLERRAGVLRYYQRPEVVRERGECLVDRELPGLRALARQEKDRRSAERLAQLEREVEARRARERERGGRGR